MRSSRRRNLAPDWYSWLPPALCLILVLALLLGRSESPEAAGTSLPLATIVVEAIAFHCETMFCALV